VPLLALVLGLGLFLFGVVRFQPAAIGGGVAVAGLAAWQVSRVWSALADDVAFALTAEGIVIEGHLRPYAEIVQARRTWDIQGASSHRDTALSLEFADGTELRIDRTLQQFKILQRSVMDHLPSDVRAGMESESMV
jgi:hypothetical protein